MLNSSLLSTTCTISGFKANWGCYCGFQLLVVFVLIECSWLEIKGRLTNQFRKYLCMFVCILMCLCEYVGVGTWYVLIRHFTLFRVFFENLEHFNEIMVYNNDCILIKAWSLSNSGNILSPFSSVLICAQIMFPVSN